MSNFLEEQKAIAASKRAEIQEKHENAKKTAEEMFRYALDYLCVKYEVLIMRAVEHNAKKGKTEFYMNFVREDFVIDGCKQKPQQICRKVLTLLTEDGKNLHGLKFDVWNNGKFTIHFWINDND
jgi:coenzyme F420-reducing hydrogenase gamma subunit